MRRQKFSLSSTASLCVLLAILNSCAPIQEDPPAPELPELLLNPPMEPIPAPTKVIGMMFNFPASEAGGDAGAPTFYVRGVNSLSRHGDELFIPDFASVLYEGELVIVIGKRATRVPIFEAESHILGYTCGMDGSPQVLSASGDRDLARSLAAKSTDSVAPVGPYVVRGIDPMRQKIELRINGQVVETLETRDMIWSPARLVSEISRTVTLERGDLIFAGARRAIPEFRPGDRVEVEITDIGILSNYVAGEPEPGSGTRRE